MAEDTRTQAQKDSDAAAEKQRTEDAKKNKLPSNADKGPKKKVRVLTETRHNGKTLKHNSIVEMTDAEITAQDGAVDAHPDAVAYVESLAPAKPASDVAL